MPLSSRAIFVTASSFSLTSSEPNYYTQDYLGNNRAVINGTTSTLEHAVAYYLYGAVIADLGTNQTSGQPYKFGGKELMTANGLNEYDFGARSYYSTVPFFTKPDPMSDPMSDKYPWLFPYLYCANNPVILIDIDGLDPIYDISGNFLGVDEKGLHGNPIMMDVNNFKNGMSHNMATRYSCNPLDNKVWEKIKKHYSTFPNRPDYDGEVTMDEGIAWAKTHLNALSKPTPDNMLYIDTSKLDFGPLSVVDFKNVGTEEPKNLYGNPLSALGRALTNSRYRDTVYGLGRCTMKLLDKNKRTVMIINDDAADYDWIGGGSVSRKISIFINNSLYDIDQDIHGFKVFYYGIGKLNQ